MELEQLGKEIQSFVNESRELTLNYQKREAELQEKVKQGLRGAVEAQQELENMKNNIYETLQEKAKKLEKKKEEIREQELSHIEETSQPVTADVLAELTLLSQMNLTSDDMQRYIEKYRRFPLALRRLQEIAQEKKIFVQFPPDRREYLNVVLGRADNHLSRFKNPKLNEMSVKIEMIADGVITGIEEDITAYRSL